jgi:hypothetical protein
MISESSVGKPWGGWEALGLGREWYLGDVLCQGTVEAAHRVGM